MTERHEELAALHALGMLEPEEARAFLGEIRYAPETMDLVAQLKDVGAELGELIPAEEPPEGTYDQIRTAISGKRKEAKVVKFKTATKTSVSWLGWAVAACLAVVSYGCWMRQHILEKKVSELVANESGEGKEVITLREEKLNLQHQLSEAGKRELALNSEITAMKQTNALVTLEVSSLRAQNNAWQDGVAVVVWDSAKQEGLLKMSRVPPVRPNKDYQLWVVDKDHPAPVSAGVVKISETGVTTFTFKPSVPVSSASKFALSIENKGGVEKNEGPIVYLGP